MRAKPQNHVVKPWQRLKSISLTLVVAKWPALEDEGNKHSISEHLPIINPPGFANEQVVKNGIVSSIAIETYSQTRCPVEKANGRIKSPQRYYLCLQKLEASYISANFTS
jgi:hypothetical protein